MFYLVFSCFLISLSLDFVVCLLINLKLKENPEVCSFRRKLDGCIEDKTADNCWYIPFSTREYDCIAVVGKNMPVDYNMLMFCLIMSS